MNSNIIYQYVSSIIKNETLYRLIRYASKYANIILDLEDSIQDVFSRKNSSNLKKQARKNLCHLSSAFSDLNVGIRINQINSPEYYKDIEFLTELKHVKWSYIVLPKIESHNEIQQCLSDISSIKYNEIILCIESKKGLNNLQSILEKINHEKILKIQFGHFDYFLDKGIFPIPKQTSPIFWETCELLIEQVEDFGFTYLHTPLNLLKSEYLTNSVVNRLKEVCRNEFGFATVSITQNFLLHKHGDSETKTFKPVFNNGINKIIYANEIINTFSKSKSNFSFEHKNTDDIFIPPQEYYAAIQYLSKL